MTILNGLAFQSFAYGTEIYKSINTGLIQWSSGLALSIDFWQSNQLLEFQNCQSVFVDNQTASTVIITCASTGHIRRVPSMTSAWYQLISGDHPQFTVTCAATSGTVQMWFTNAPAPAQG